MTLRPELDGLPVEVVESVVSHLGLEDICRLRLVSQELATKSSQGSFKANFVTKSVTFSKPRLDTFVEVTRRGGLGCLLQNLRVIGFVPLPKEKLDQLDIAATVRLLETALTNVRANSAHGRLRSLTLSLDGALGGGSFVNPKPSAELETVWQIAGATAELVSSAVKSCAINVEELDFYSTATRCALSSRRLVPSLQAFDIRKLRALWVSFSAEENAQAQDEKPSNASQIARLLEATRLEDLELHWYKLRDLDTLEADMDECGISEELGRLSLPSLKKVSLKGLYASQEALLAFFSRNGKIRKVSLEWIHLKGRFGPVFEYLHKQLELEYLYLNDLWEDRLVRFPEAKGEPHFLQTGKGGPSWIERTGEEARAPIKYQSSKGRTLGSPRANRWHFQRSMEYGPP